MHSQCQTRQAILARLASVAILQRRAVAFPRSALARLLLRLVTMSTGPVSALDAGNEVFHEAYSAKRDEVRHEVPILVVSPTELILRSASGRRSYAYCRPSFGSAKSTAHIAVALFTSTQSESPDAQSRARVTQLAEHTTRALERLPSEPNPLNDEIRTLLEHCKRFAESAREQAAPAPAAQADFARDAGPRILRITELATRDQIAGLHEKVELALSTLSADEQPELQVVVLGDHQARTRSLGMQYFQRRLREEPGADERVTYGENIDSEEEAFALVATRRLDRLIARAFFGEEKRLQRDVLGDAAKRCLEAMQFDS